MKILVVDDEEIVRFVMTEKLVENGFSVTEAHDGREATELFRQSLYDAVLLDLKMPGMDGIETLRELRRHDPDIPVIMVTAFGDIPTAVEAIKLGAYDFVEKPPQISRIVMTLSRAIEKSELERKLRSMRRAVEESALLREAYNKLKEMDRMKTAFLSSVSHELRTPLTSIAGYAEIIRRKLVKGLIPRIESDLPRVSNDIRQVQENLEILIAEAGRLAGLVDNVLDLTEMEAGTTEWRWEPVSLREVIDKAVVELSVAFEEKGLEFVREIEEGLPLITGDRERLFRVIKQLLSNALKFTERGRVTCSARKTNNEVIVCVADTGNGIPSSQHRVIFDKFKQIGEVLTDKPTGIGLGLPICRIIVERHGGRIGIESEPGKGSAFVVSFPLGAEARP